jgi:pyruvate formate-lyase/glycerol dehydratase family glycyl radical enzyme
MSRVDELFENVLARGKKKKELWPREYTTILDSPEVVRESLIVRKALAFKKYLSEMPIEIYPKELIVGLTSQGTIGMGVAFIDYATEEEKEKAAEKGLSIKSIWGHSTPLYDRILEVGVKGMEELAQARLESLDKSEDSYQRKVNFLNAVVICYDGLEALIRRYAHLSAVRASEEEDESRKAELLEIASICTRIAVEPPETFREAIQLLWFVHMAFHSTMDYVPLGRFDYYMYPFYQRDLEAGLISPEQAQELVDCFWLKTNDRAQLQSGLIDNKFDSSFMQLGGAFDIELENELLTNAWQQNVILSGLHSDGSDSTNDLTYMALESTRKYPLVNPVVTVRLNKNSSDRLLRKCAECLQGGGGYPFIHNDDVIIKALEKLGIPKEDANVYANDGCWEATIPGSTEFRYSYIELLLCVELALNRGRRRIDGKMDGLDTGDPTEFKSFEDVYQAFQCQVQHKLNGFVENITTYYGAVYEIAPDPFLSSLTDGCIESGRDLTEGGARYIFHAPLVAGLADAVNSLAAINQAVFEDKILDMRQLIDLLGTNFQGKENLRQFLLNRVPKYGNDNDYVDEIALRVVETYTSEVNRKAREYDWIRFPCGAGTFERYILLGKRVGATPDGRREGDSIATNCGPSIGSDQEGLSALIKSFTKIDLTEFPAGSPLNIKVGHNFAQGEEGAQRIVSLLKAFLSLGGNMLTIMVQDTETLRRAQREPEKYRGLKVTVGGFQAYFTLLSPEHQEYHIQRTEHGLI